jgi:pimeloyl-ACP methyl ester carboxylesterase
MDAALVQGTEFDIDLPTGRVHAQRFGSVDAPLALCLPGLSANLTIFDYLCERIAGDHLQTVAVDLRGRGKSAITGPGAYGWDKHARDVFALADRLGAKHFSIIGQSMGGGVAIEAAAQDADRLEKIVLLDLCGTPDPSTLPAISATVNRLGQVFPSPEVYVEAVKAIGLIDPWSDCWDRYFGYELETVDGGVRARSNRDAVLQDFSYGERWEPYPLWQCLTMPVLLLYASREILSWHGAHRQRHRSIALSS